MKDGEKLAVIGVAIVAAIAVFMMFGFGSDAGITGNVSADIESAISLGVLGRVLFVVVMLAACYKLYFKG